MLEESAKAAARGGHHYAQSRLAILHSFAEKGSLRVRRHFGSRLALSFAILGWLHIQYKVNGCPQEMSAVGPGDQCVDRLQSVIRQFQIVRYHDDGNRRANPLDLICNHCDVQPSEG